jgi:hypothetical protein
MRIRSEFVGGEPRYDPATHKYRRLSMPIKYASVSACGSLPVRTLRDVEIDREHPKPEIDVSDRTVQYYPKEFAAYEWTIKGIGTKFDVISRTHTVNGQDFRDVPSEACHAQVKLPIPGSFEVTLRVRLKNGEYITTSLSKTITELPPSPFLMVSIGDSAASGEGNPHPGRPLFPFKCDMTSFTGVQDLIGFKVNMWKEPGWAPEPMAHRSHFAGPFRAAQQLRDRRKEGIWPYFLSFATSGAEIEKGLLKPQHSWQEPFGGQLDEIKNTVGNNTIDALIISIGVNDVGFSGAVKMFGIYPEFETFWKDKSVSSIRGKIDGLPDKYRKLQARIKSLNLNVRKVYLTEYPTGLFNNGEGVPSQGCGIFDNAPGLGKVSGGDAVAIRDAGKALNEVLRKMANELGWVYVDGISVKFNNHGYCAPQSYFVGARDSCLNQGDFLGTLHPNKYGHKVYADQIMEAIIKHHKVVPSPLRGEETR